ncbi:MAG: glycosyltransferase family 39 protein [Actinomycetota bacterium]|nr:glycosyltransferase family 39 protein [Actinomycetota bacterium]
MSEILSSSKGKLFSKYLFVVALSGVMVSRFSYLTFLDLGEIRELLEHFCYYPCLYSLSFCLAYLTLSFAYILLFSHLTRTDLQEAAQIDLPTLFPIVLLLPYVISYRCVLSLLGPSLFCVALGLVVIGKLYLLQKYIRKNRTPEEAFIYLSLIGIVLVGFALRLYLLLTSHWMVGSEEAIMGLMGRHILLKGECHVFLWGQPYMGSLEALMAVPIFFLFGASSLSLKLVPFTFSIIFIILIYVLAARIFNEEVGLLSALVVAVSPVFLTVFSTLANAYMENLVYGTLILILLHRIVYGGDALEKTKLYAFLGFLAGVAFWNNLTVVMYIATAGLFLLLKERLSIFGRKLAYLVFFFALGCSPLLYFNLRHSWRTFRLLFEGTAAPSISEKLLQIGSNFYKLFGGVILPIMGLGYTIYPVDILVYLLYASTFIYVLYQFRKRILFFWQAVSSGYGAGIETLSAFFLFLILFFVFTKYGALNEARYVLGLYTVLPIFLGAFLYAVGRRSKVLAGVFLCFVLLSNLAGNLADSRISPPRADLLAKFLESRDIEYAYAGFWTAYQLTFVAKEKVICSPSSGPDVYPAYTEAVKAAPLDSSGFIFPAGESRWQLFESELDELDVTYLRDEVVGNVIYHSFSEEIDPKNLPLP